MAHVFLLLDQYGETVGDTDTLEDAVQAADELGAGEVFLDRSAIEEPSDYQPNRPATADEAWAMIPRLPPLPGYPTVQRAGEPLRIDPDVCADMTLEEAYERLKPLIPTRNGQIPLNVRTPTALRRYFLGTNLKTDMRELQKVLDKHKAKTGSYPPAALIARLQQVAITGLSLLPARFWYSRYRGEDSVVEVDGRRVALRDVLRRDINLCGGSSKECREACLVGTGNNEADPWNIMPKVGKTSMFLLDPEAFMVMLMNNINFAKDKAHEAGYDQFVRLNVYQDVPWEFVFPEMFEYHNDVYFYDYTKVPGRKTPENYDLTYSYSGRNMAASVDEMKRGRRVAAVFQLPKHVYPRTIEWGPGIEVLQGRQPVRADTIKVDVYDGDLTDVRPFDPAPSLVALSYKAPMVKAGTGEERMARAQSGESAKGVAQIRVEAPPYFIVPATLVQLREGGKKTYSAYVMSVTPRQEGYQGSEADSELLTGSYGGAISAQKLRLPVLPPE